MLEQILKKQRALLTCACVLLLLLTTFLLPYHVPVVPTVSLAYVAGFNSRAAVIGFVVSSFLLAFVWVGKLGPPGTQDRKLPRTLGVCTVLLFTALAFAWQFYNPILLIGESTFLINRQLLLDHGKIPYLQFEYTYSPGLLYPGYWFHHFLGLSVRSGYFLYWVISWAVGSCMVVYIFRNVDVRTHRRVALFLFAAGWLPLAMRAEGIQYTPVRLFCCAMLALCIYKLKSAGVKSYGLATAMFVAVTAALAISAEQGIGLVIGLSLYAIAMRIFEPAIFPLKALAFQLSLFLTAIWIAAHFHLFETVRAFGAGGYTLPLLLTPSSAVILSVYVFAIIDLCGRLRQGDIECSTVPLTLCGLPMLASAMGRCDSGHLVSATPIWIAGLFVIHSRKHLFRVWAPLAWITIYGFIVFPAVIDIVAPKLNTPWKAKTVTSPTTASEVNSGPNQPIDLSRAYYVPLYLPTELQLAVPALSVDTGYYSGLENVTTPAAAASKLQEIRAHSNEPFLLPTDLTIGGLDRENLDSLRSLETSFYVPRAVNAPFDWTPVMNAILSGHRPGPQVIGSYRGWEPTTTSH